MAELADPLSSSSAHVDKMLAERRERAQRRLEKRRRRRAREQQRVDTEVGAATTIDHDHQNSSQDY